MNTTLSSSEENEKNVVIPSVWVRPATRPDGRLGNRTGEDIAEWDGLVSQVVSAAAVNGWTKAEVARRVGRLASGFPAHIKDNCAIRI